jgi:hypothetical protein
MPTNIPGTKTAPGRRTIRLLWAIDFLFFLAAVLPGLLGHPYPRPIGPYITYGFIGVYLALALWIIRLVAKGRAETPK